MIRTNRTPRGRYRTETRLREVPHTIDGITRTITEPYTVTVPVPPRDWDRAVLTGATTAVALILTASVAWSTASIGDLLSQAVAPPVAYAAAAAFDLAWIVCMALEWLARYDAARARRPRAAGHLALAIAMTAVCAHGWLTGSPAVGIIGALVSAIAKGLWSILIAHTARPLDDRTRQWVEQQQAEASARLGLIAVRRQLARAEDALTAEHAALALPEEPPAPEPEQPTAAASRAAGTVRSAVRAAIDAMPDATPAEIATTLTGLGITVTPDDVRDLTPAPMMRPDTSPDMPQLSGLSKADAIRLASRILGPGASPGDIAVHLARHGISTDAAYVRTTLSREAKQQRQQQPQQGTGGYM